MGRVQGAQGFNKEQLAFLVVAAIAALSVYFYLSSGPVELEPGKPIAAGDPPKPLNMKPPADPLQENYYVVDGQLTRLMDPRTGQAVNRQRKTPFMPAAKFIERVKKEPPANLTPPPPPPPEPQKEAEPTKRDFGPKDLVAEVEFMGVVSLNGKTYGLVRPKDGSSPRRVKVGDKIPDYNYTVTRIEKQTIYVEDEEKNPFVLRDTDDVEGGDSDKTNPFKPTGGTPKAKSKEKPTKPVAAKKATPDVKAAAVDKAHAPGGAGGGALDKVIDEALKNPDAMRQKVEQRLKERAGRARPK